jgi:methylmalonyl-CoA mutase cobalamin-binding domain/chain
MGIIPDQDIPELKKLGVAEVLQPGSSMEKVVRAFCRHLTPIRPSD